MFEFSATFPETEPIFQLLDLVPDLTEFNAGLAGELVEVTREHFLSRNAEAQDRTAARYSGTRGSLNHSNFWAEKAEGLTASSDENHATVNIPTGEDGDAQFARLLGPVTITAQNAANLTIPACAEAYGKCAADFEALRFVPYATGAKALVLVEGDPYTDSTGRIRLHNRVETPMFWLLPSVTLPQDSTVLPADETLNAVAERCAGEHLDKLAQQFQELINHG